MKKVTVKVTEIKEREKAHRNSTVITNGEGRGGEVEEGKGG